MRATTGARPARAPGRSGAAGRVAGSPVAAGAAAPGGRRPTRAGAGTRRRAARRPGAKRPCSAIRATPKVASPAASQDGERGRAPEQEAPAPVGPGHHGQVGQDAGVAGLDRQHAVEGAERQRDLPPGQVLLAPAQARRHDAGPERLGGPARVGEEGGERLVGPVDPVGAQDRGEPVADLAPRSAGRAAGVEGQARDHQAGQRLPQRRIHRTWIGEVAGDQAVQRRAGVGRLEGEPSGAQPVEDGAEGEDVGPLVRLAPVHDLGGHVVRGPDHGAGHGHPVVLGEDPGDAEVGELHRRSPPELADHHVLGLEVPVDDAGGVGVRQRVGEGQPDERPALREGNALLVGEGPQRPRRGRTR